jgi:hypothetical protein
MGLMVAIGGAVWHFAAAPQFVSGQEMRQKNARVI